jgi:AcrR family transcriptional regulator
MSTAWGENPHEDNGATATVARRPPGRPRDVHVHRAVLVATLDLLAEKGWSGLTMEGVAARARTAKGTVYRWWSSKVDLVIEALVTEGAPYLPAPDTGSFYGDYVVVLEGLAAGLRDRRSRLVASLLFEASRNPELGRAFREHLTQARRNHLVDAAARGIERGELRPDVDVDVLVDAGVAQLLYRYLVAGEDIDADLPRRVARQVIEGATAR